MVRAIFLDIDGTLLSHRRHAVPADARAALSALREKGVRVYAATGRHILELRALPLDGLAFDGYVTLTGQICLDGAGKPLYARPIAPEDAQTIAALFAEKTIPIQLVEEERLYINLVNDRVRRTLASISTEIPALGDYRGDALYQASLYVDVPEAERVRRRLTDCDIVSWHRDAVDVYPKAGGKAAGIRALLRYEGISKSDIMAFGDGENDISMLTLAGIGVAMGNAPETVKRAADYVTSDIDEGGLANALRHYGVL